MFNSSVLDVAVGLLFVYLLLGLICTTANEWIARALRSRAETLKQGIRGLLNAPPDGTYVIRSSDIAVAALAKRFGQADDKLALAIGPFDQLLRSDIDGYAAALGQNPAAPAPPGLAANLAEKLNAALDQTALREKIGAVRVTLESGTESGKQLKSEDLRRLNLAFLNEAYPGEIMSLSEEFYKHALIKSLARPGEHPSYIPATTFALTLLDILGRGQSAAVGTDRLTQIKSSIAVLPDSDVKTSLQAILRNGGDSVETVQTRIESWFDCSMDRVSGWYKKRTQIWTIVVASSVAILVNADTIDIAQKLMINPALRGTIVEQAKNNPSSSTLTAQQKADLSSLTGWTDDFRTFHRLEACTRVKLDSNCAQSPAPPEIRNDIASAALWDRNSFPGLDLWSPNVFPWIWTVIPRHLLGWTLTAIAASMGAPFWFDILNKFMNIRSAGTAPNEKQSDKSKA